MEPLQGLNRAMQYIEAHLKDELDMREVARRAMCSADSFSRLFSMLSGCTLREYIRRRRLTRAAYALRDTDAKVTDIALDYGYQSVDAFSRAFARQHGAAPLQVRKGAPIRAALPVSFHLAVKGAENMEFEVREMQEMVLYGLHTRMECDAGGRFAREHELWASECDNLPGRLSDDVCGTWYGVWQSGSYAVARAQEDIAHRAAQCVCIPAGKYAVFTSDTGGFAGEVLPRMRSVIFEKCLRDAGLEQAEDTEIEVYHLFPKEEKHRRYYEYWVPVK